MFQFLVCSLHPSEQATCTWCAKAYKWNRKEYNCRRLEWGRPCQGHVLWHDVVKYCALNWRWHPFGAETITCKRPNVLGMSTPLYGTDTCCRIHGCDGCDLGACLSALLMIPGGLKFHLIIVDSWNSSQRSLHSHEMTTEYWLFTDLSWTSSKLQDSLPITRTNAPGS